MVENVENVDHKIHSSVHVSCGVKHVKHGNPFDAFQIFLSKILPSVCLACEPYQVP